MINTEVLEEKSTLITRLTELAESGKYVFRGYSKQDQLQPNIIRKKLVEKETGIPIFSVVKLDVIDGKVVIEKTIED